RVWFLKPYRAHRDCTKCTGKVDLWMFGNEVYRVTARKDDYHEVDEFICNECRFDHKQKTDWTIEGVRKMEKWSVINQGKYMKNKTEVKIDTDKFLLLGREEDRERLSMVAPEEAKKGK
ncbi:MAG: Fe-S-binding protein, partial [Bacteroidetes bacterium]|nr:Fe-S-binding protein [Bacteroidota bacterium]